MTNKVTVKKKKRVVTGFLLISILFTISMFFIYLRYYEKRYDEQIDNIIAFEKAENIFENCGQNMHDSLEQDYIGNILGFCGFYMKQNGYSTQGLMELQKFMNLSLVYYCEVYADSEVGTASYISHKSPDIAPLKLDSKEAFYLFNEGKLRNEGNIYRSAKVKDNKYIVVSYKASEGAFIDKSALEDSGSIHGEQEIMYDETLDDTIIYSTEPELFGKKVDVLLDLDTRKELLGLLGDGKLVQTVDHKLVYAGLDRVGDGLIVGGYMPANAMLGSFVRNLLLIVSLYWAMGVPILLYVLKLIDEQGSQDSTIISYVPFSKGKYIDRRISSHIVAIVVFSMILMLFVMAYIQTLNSYSEENLSASADLQDIAYNYEYNIGAWLTAQEEMELHYEEITNQITNYLMLHPEQATNETLDSLLKWFDNCKKITLYDQTGTAQYSTDRSSIGYTLSHDENRKDYLAWDIINGNSSLSCYYEKDDTFIVMGRRQDQKGIVRLEITCDYMDEFSKMCELDSNMVRFDFGESEMGYVYLNDPSHLQWFTSDSEKAVSVPVKLPEEMLTNGYSGHYRILGIRYYINTFEYQGIIFLNAISLGTVIGFGTDSMWWTIIITFLLMLGLFIQSVVRSDITEEQIFSQHRRSADNIVHISNNLRLNIEEQLMDNGFRRTIQQCFTMTGILLLGYLILDSMLNRNSLLAYLFSSQWNKGINLFSITMIVILVVCSLVATLVLQKLIILFTSNMGSRVVTIGGMISSILKFGILIFVIIMILIDLGANPSTLLAGAGVTGAMISFCAQNTVNDLLSGFFIVFEGTFHIGDWIQVDDWRGQVVEISVRTTKVSIGDSVRVICNSELKKVTILSDNLHGAITTIDVAYKENLDHVIALLENSFGAFREEIPDILDGPYIDGVTELGNDGVTIRMWATTTTGKEFAVERKLRLATKRLFDENGIEIPFNQLTLHMADDQEADGNKDNV